MSTHYMVRCPRCDMAAWECRVRNDSAGLLWLVANRGYIVALMALVEEGPISVEASITVGNVSVSTSFLSAHLDHELEVVSEYGEVVHGG